MSLKVELLGSMALGSAFRIRLSIGEIITRASPGSISDNYRDLIANRGFLAERRLSTFFVGEEPLVNLLYDDKETVIAYIYKKTKIGSEKICAKFQIPETLSHLDGAIKSLEKKMNEDHIDALALVKQVEEDTAHGIYNIYLSENGATQS